MKKKFAVVTLIMLVFQIITLTLRAIGMIECSIWAVLSPLWLYLITLIIGYAIIGIVIVLMIAEGKKNLEKKDTKKYIACYLAWCKIYEDFTGITIKVVQEKEEREDIPTEDEILNDL